MPIRGEQRESRTFLSREFGDFQTPPALVSEVLASLGHIGEKWPRVLEPTCGRGNFVRGLLSSPVPPSEIQAIELQHAHFKEAQKTIEYPSMSHVVVKKANVFDLDLRHDLKWSSSGPLLIVGNPPWVTSAELSVLKSDNLPTKTNLKRLQGLDALTGSSNFDIAEYIWLKLIRELAPERATIALLCKIAVARNVLRFAFDADLPITHASIRKIDAKKWFRASVEACLFRVDIGPGERRYEADVFPNLQAEKPGSVMGFVNGQLIADTKAHKRSAFADGVCPLNWRQGIKHDAASVMELVHDNSGCLMNKLGEAVEVESEHVYPLLKSSDLFHGANPQKYVIVTQRTLKENTNQLKWTAPLLWDYLTLRSEVFKRRKSSIYRNKSSFAVFGVGDYSFNFYKVGVSGLHKTPKFRALGPAEGRPVMLDDTSYFVPCRSPEQAVLLSGLLNDPACLELIRSIIFVDSKRPVTKKLLQRIDLGALLKQSDRCSLLTRAESELGDLMSAAKWQEIVDSVSLEEILFKEVPYGNLDPQMALDL